MNDINIIMIKENDSFEYCDDIETIGCRWAVKFLGIELLSLDTKSEKWETDLWSQVLIAQLN